jgi:hypothetical protein
VRCLPAEIAPIDRHGQPRDGPCRSLQPPGLCAPEDRWRGDGSRWGCRG